MAFKYSEHQRKIVNQLLDVGFYTKWSYDISDRRLQLFEGNFEKIFCIFSDKDRIDYFVGRDHSIEAYIDSLKGLKTISMVAK